MPNCRCVKGDCLRCSCSVAGRFYSPNCKCGTIRPRTNTPLVNVPLNPTAQVTMANQQLIDALTALTGQMNINHQAQTAAQNQLHHDLIVQQQAQQDILAQLANPPVVQHAAQQGPRSSAVLAIPVYTGQATDNLTDWLSILNRTAVAEGWVDDVKRRVAIGKLSGPALRWQDMTGHGHALWPAWLAALQATFQPRLSLVQWCLQIESRVQLPNESGAQYALEKMRVCNLCPHQLPVVEAVNYLSKGLYHPDQRAIMLANPPADLAAFIVRIRDLEAIGNNTVPPQAPPVPHVGSLATQPDLATVLKTFGDQIIQIKQDVRDVARAVGQPPTTSWRSPSPRPLGPTHVGPSAAFSSHPVYNEVFARRPRLPLNEITCYNCNYKGHYAVDCPEPRRPTRPPPVVASYSYPENDAAGPWGQDRLDHQ